MAEKIIYQTGDKIGLCFYISDEPSVRHGKRIFRVAKFKCVCGKELIRSISDMKTCRVSCGCARGKAHTRHGYAKAGSKLTEYTTWLNIKRRCYLKTHQQYKDYGGRGISVCERWINSFDNFIADMRNKPTPKHTIERINNDGNYDPANCKWATMKEQNRNKRNSKR